MDNPERETVNIGNTRHRAKTNKTKTQHRKLKERATRTPLKNQGWGQVFARGGQFLLAIRHPPCYKILVVEEINVYVESKRPIII